MPGLLRMEKELSTEIPTESSNSAVQSRTTRRREGKIRSAETFTWKIELHQIGVVIK